MSAHPVPLAIADFWVPVSQIVPVFALAFVLEARRYPRRWTVMQRVERWSAGIYLLAIALDLVAIEILALLFMAQGKSDKDAVILIVIMLGLLITLLVLGPVFAVTVDGFSDIPAMAFHLVLSFVPRVRRWRSHLTDVRAQIAEALNELEDQRQEAERTLRGNQRSIRKQRRQLARVADLLSGDSLNAKGTAEAKLLRKSIQDGINQRKEIRRKGRLALAEIEERLRYAQATQREAEDLAAQIGWTLSPDEIERIEQRWAKYRDL